MLHTIVDLNEVFHSADKASVGLNSIRSSNPYDYIRSGYYLDNVLSIGGQQNVNYNCNFSGNRTSTDFHIADK